MLAVILPVLLLALALVAISAHPAAMRAGWRRAVRIVVLAALTIASGVLLLRYGAAETSQRPQSALDLFALAAACFMIGGLMLFDQMRAARAAAVPSGGGAGGKGGAKPATAPTIEPSLLRTLGESAEALAVGAAAGTLTVLSVAFAGVAGLAGSSAGLYLISVLGGLLALLTLPSPTLFHVGLAAAAWLSIVRGMAGSALAASDTLLPGMLALFLLVGWLGGMLRPRPHP